MINRGWNLKSLKQNELFENEIGINMKNICESYTIRHQMSRSTSIAKYYLAGYKRSQVGFYTGLIKNIIFLSERRTSNRLLRLESSGTPPRQLLEEEHAVLIYL